MNVRFIVCLSVNVEDLVGMSGVGLYELIFNVKFFELENFGKVVV